MESIALISLAIALIVNGLWLTDISKDVDKLIKGFLIQEKLLSERIRQLQTEIDELRYKEKKGAIK